MSISNAYRQKVKRLSIQQLQLLIRARKRLLRFCAKEHQQHAEHMELLLKETARKLNKELKK